MPEDNIKTVIGFDYGTHWTGVAVGQTLTSQANPLKAIKSINLKPDWQAIKRLLDEWKPQKLIVGLPTKLNDDDDEMTAIAKNLADNCMVGFTSILNW